MASGDELSAAPGSGLRKHRGTRALGLLIAAACLLTAAVLVHDRWARELVELDGTVAQVGAERSGRPSGVALVTAPYLAFTLAEPRFLEGHYRPEFRFTPPPWSGTAGLADGLAPGAPVRVTVARGDLDDAIADLAERERKEQRGEIYAPSPFGSPGIVEIVRLRAEPDVELSESPLVFGLALGLCLFGAAAFGAAGARWLRERPPPA